MLLQGLKFGMTVGPCYYYFSTQAERGHAHTKHNIHRDYTSTIISCPRTLAPLNRIRIDKAIVHRRVCKVVMYV